jgi:hypothetical protein
MYCDQIFRMYATDNKTRQEVKTMRETKNNEEHPELSTADKNWLKVHDLAQAQVSSEDIKHPIESALTPTGLGWRAAQPGEQTVRLVFAQPQKIRGIRLVFLEDRQERTQEFVLRWSRDRGQTYQEIVRQQYNFSPPITTQELEDYAVEIQELTTLELIIVPDISAKPAHASVAQLRLA